MDSGTAAERDGGTGQKLRHQRIALIGIFVAFVGVMLRSSPSPVQSDPPLLNKAERVDSVADPSRVVLRFQQANLHALQMGGGAYSSIIKDLRDSLGQDVPLVVRPPFVLTGDFSPSELSHWHRDTIEPASRAIAFRYLSKLPDRPIVVLLFSQAAAYRQHCQRLFGRDDFSVYGFYSPERRTLILNLSTGSGTLVHELTHALVDVDFPNIPDWFNEGFASLHEECRFVDLPSGPAIEGLVNWRLAELRKALDSGELRPIPELLAANDFRSDRLLLNYAHARYLCLFLQERGRLSDYYSRFRDSAIHDPIGSQTLLEVLESSDWESAEKEFRSWLVGLSLPHAENSQGDSVWQAPKSPQAAVPTGQ